MTSLNPAGIPRDNLTIPLKPYRHGAFPSLAKVTHDADDLQMGSVRWKFIEKLFSCSRGRKRKTRLPCSSVGMGNLLANGCRREHPGRCAAQHGRA